MEFVDDIVAFLLISFISNFIGGLGSGVNITASMTIVSSTFIDEERDKYIGWIEASCGLGLILGPLIGSFLYTFGGYACPFITITVIFSILYPFIMYHLFKGREENKKEEGITHI